VDVDLWIHNCHRRDAMINHLRKGTEGLHLACQVKVPAEYQKTPWNPPPNTEEAKKKIHPYFQDTPRPENGLCL